MNIENIKSLIAKIDELQSAINKIENMMKLEWFEIKNNNGSVFIYKDDDLYETTRLLLAGHSRKCKNKISKLELEIKDESNVVIIQL